MNLVQALEAYKTRISNLWADLGTNLGDNLLNGLGLAACLSVQILTLMYSLCLLS